MQPSQSSDVSIAQPGNVLVGRDDDSSAVLTSRDEPFAHAVPGCGIEPVERLVEQQDGRAGRNCRRKRQASPNFIGERLDRRAPVQAYEICRDARLLRRADGARRRQSADIRQHEADSAECGWGRRTPADAGPDRPR